MEGGNAKKVKREKDQRANEERLRLAMDKFRREAGNSAAVSLTALGKDVTEAQIRDAVDDAINENIPDTWEF